MQLNLQHISPLPLQIETFLFDLTKNSSIHRLIVFGSRAHTDFEKYSDIDLAIDAPLISKRNWLLLKEIAYYDIKTVLQISLVHYNSNPIRLQNRILTTGKIIYVK